MTTTPVSPSAAASRPTEPTPSRAADPPLSARDLRLLAGSSAQLRDPRRASFRAVLGERGAKALPEPLGACPPKKDVRVPGALEQDDGPRARRPRPLGSDRRDDAEPSLEAFRPPSAILAPPAATLSRVAGSGLERSEAAALAERLVVAMRVGRVGRDGHVVQLRIRGASGGDIEVRLRHEDGKLGIVLVADGAALGDAHRIERALKDELGARGLTLDAIAVEPAL